MWIFGNMTLNAAHVQFYTSFIQLKRNLLDFYMILQSFSLYCGCFIPLALVYLFIHFFFFSGEETLK